MTSTPGSGPNPWQYPGDRYYYGWYNQPPPSKPTDGPPPSKPTDGEIKSNVVDRLRVNPHTKDHDLQVDVKQSVVILTGKVSSAVRKRAAGDDCWDTAGVVDVSNQLIVAARS
jgi:osmotically-inducible protein OsmY